MSKAHYIIPIFVPHEGCPHDCVFCNQNSISGETRKVDSEYATATIEDYLKTLPEENRIIEVSFYGGTFTAIAMDKQKGFLAVAKKYKDMGKIDYIRLSTRPDYIDKEILDNLKAFTVDIIELGVQSMDEEVLIKAGRGHTKEDVVAASRLIKEYGFTLGHQIMLGLPGDNEEKDLRTAEEIIGLNPELCRIYPALVIKGTAMEKMFLEGRYDPYSLEEAVKISKLIYYRLAGRGIKVIRIGLQPTESIALGKDIVAGPFHPSFRELVESSIYNEMISCFIKDKRGDIEVRVNSRELSKLFADKKHFFNDMKRQYTAVNLRISADNSLERDCVLAVYEGKCYKMSINDFIIKKS